MQAELTSRGLVNPVDASAFIYCCRRQWLEETMQNSCSYAVLVGLGVTCASIIGCLCTTKQFMVSCYALVLATSIGITVTLMHTLRLNSEHIKAEFVNIANQCHALPWEFHDCRQIGLKNTIPPPCQTCDNIPCGNYTTVGGMHKGLGCGFMPEVVASFHRYVPFLHKVEWFTD